MWHHEEKNGRFPAYTINVIVSTGAGDAFHGAFAASLAQSQNWPDTLRHASAAAALCCTKVGARTGIPTRTEVAQFLSQRG
jgi:sulfofructose kinase